MSNSIVDVIDPGATKHNDGLVEQEHLAQDSGGHVGWGIGTAHFDFEFHLCWKGAQSGLQRHRRLMEEGVRRG
jgi:hypothetical protein